jgi:hypothetical protein
MGTGAYGHVRDPIILLLQCNITIATFVMHASGNRQPGAGPATIS